MNRTFFNGISTTEHKCFEYTIYLLEVEAEVEENKKREKPK